MRKLLLYIANRIQVILSLYVVSIFVAAFLFAHFENKSYMDGIWWSCVTSLTIGYGDLAPVTLEGRIMAILFAHFWIFCVIPMIVASIITKILVDKSAFTHDEQEWQEKSLSKIADKLGITLDPPPRDF
nr:potassium channel family protein [uncultured Undibacterium sp.]